MRRTIFAPRSARAGRLARRVAFWIAALTLTTSARVALGGDGDPPKVRSIRPANATRGQSLEIAVEGTGLFPVTEVSTPNREIGVVAVTGSTASRLLLRVTLPDGAPEGPLSLTIRTKYGVVVTDKFSVRLRTPVVSRVRPTTLPRGEAYDVVVEGSRFVLGGEESRISVEAPLSVKRVKGDDSSMTLRVTVPPDAPVGPKSLTIETADGKVTTPLVVALSPPSVTKIEPSHLPRGRDSTLHVTGTYLARLSSVSLAVPETDLVVSLAGTPEAGTASLRVQASGSAAPGERTLLFHSTDGLTTGSFVLDLAPPTLDALDPPGAARGTTVTVKWSATGLPKGTIPTVVPADASVVVTATEAGRWKVAVAPEAAPGPRTFVVATPDGTAATTFLVGLRGPTVTGLVPSEVAAGAEADVSYEGQNLEGARWEMLPADPEVTLEARAPGTLHVAVAAGARSGPRALLCRTADGTTITYLSVAGPAGAFPVVKSVRPLRVLRGAATEVSVEGMNLRAAGDHPPEVSVTDADGATVAATIVANTASELRLRIQPSPTAPLGGCAIGIRMPEGSTGAAVAIVPAAPAIADVAPATLRRPGKVTVVVKGSGLLGPGRAAPALSLALADGSRAVPVTLQASAPDALTLVVDLGPAVVPGPYLLLVTTPDGAAAVPLPVAPSPPRIASMTPVSFGVPTADVVTLEGENLLQPDGTAPLLQVLRPLGAAGETTRAKALGRERLTLDLSTRSGTPAGPRVLVLKTADGTATALFDVVDAPPPRVTGIDLREGTRFGKFLTTIRGTGLSGVTAVEASGSGVEIRVIAGGTDTELQVQVAVSKDAAAGPRTLTVVAPGGRATGPGLVFTVR